MSDDKQVPVLRCDGSNGLRISPISGLGGGLTIEAWIAPSTPGEARAVATLGFRGYQLALVAGGGHQDVALVMSASLSTIISQSEMRVSAPAGLARDTWSHVAVTFQLKRSGIDAAVYAQGQQLAARSWQSTTDQLLFKLLRSLTGGGFASSCTIGRAFGKLPGFAGSVAELRVWERALAPADIAAGFRRRAAGDEPGLVACYRLDEIVRGCVFDVSPRHGFALARSSSLAAASGLPLPSTTSGTRIEASGKLVREWVSVLQPRVTDVPSPFPQRGDANAIQWPTQKPAGSDLPKWKKQEVRVFDATLRPRSPTGEGFAGQEVEVRVDEPLVALIDTATSTEWRRWSPGETYRMAIPASGVLRLRFVADSLACPAIRARVAGMPEGLWTVVRPDGPMLGRLRAVTRADLQKPADGRPSPLPARASDADADALASLLRAVGRALPPAAPARTGMAAVPGASSKSFFGSLGHVAEQGYDYIKEGADQAGDLAGDGADKVVGVTQDALAGATRHEKTASQLLVRGGAALDDLVEKARQTPARLGAEAIGAYVRAADTIAVTVTAAENEVVHVFEIVGTCIVDGATACWRVVVSGINDALAAAAAFIERAGAAVSRFIDYLAFLFNWNDFLAASDQAYAYCQAAVSRMPAALAGLDPYREQLEQLVASTVDQTLGQKSIATLCGIDVDPHAPAIEELQYVVEQLEQVLDAGLDLFDGLVAGTTQGVSGLGADLVALGAGDAAAASPLPLDKLGDPVAVLTTPIVELLTGKSSAGAYIDTLFQRVQDGIHDTLASGVKLLDSRLYAPKLTPFIESTILGGRQLTVLRLVALCAAIAKVLSDKLAASARSGGGARASTRTSIALAPRSSTSSDPQPAPASSPSSDDNDDGGQQGSDWDLWVPMAFGLLNTTIMAVQTGVEWRSRDQAEDQRPARLIAFLSMTSACMVTVRGLIQIVQASTVPQAARAYGLAAFWFETVAGFWTFLSAVHRLRKPRDAAACDAFDTLVFALTTVGMFVSATIAMGRGLVTGDKQVAAFGLRTSSWVVNGLARTCAALDNEARSDSYKKATLWLLAFAAIVDISEASYDHAYDIQSS